MDTRRLENAMRLIEIRHTGICPDLVNELDHHMSGVDRDMDEYPEGYIEADALEDVESQIDNAYREGLREALVLNIRKQLRESEIALGLVVPRSFMDEHHAQWISPVVYTHGKVAYFWKGSE